MKGLASKKVSAERIFLVRLVNESSESFLRENSFLDRLEDGDLTNEEWRQFAAQRYLAALPFERLLSVCREAAATAGDNQLAQVIDANLRDEMGTDVNGDPHPELSHAIWRKDFYIALGIDEASLKSAFPSDGTKEYGSSLENMIEQGNPVVMAGAILTLEGTIPREFTRIRRGRDMSFPKIFVEQKFDSKETKARKAKARSYLDDHISHDAQVHYPNLLDVLEKYATTDDGRRKIESGAGIIVRAKKRFYEDRNFHI